MWVNTLTVIDMHAEVITTQLPSIDLELIEIFVKKGEFKGISDFFRCAVRRMIAELTQRELDLFSTAREMDEDGLERMHNEIKDIRR